jgi:hypothetical protein
MRWRVTALAALLAAVALAGCGGKDSGANQVRLGDGTRLSLDLPPEQAPEPEDIRGAISGVVVDDAIFPVPGATVAVRDRDHEAVADADGRFVFEQMPPGLYTLEVRKPGHADGLGTVNVRSGQVAKAVLQVPRLPAVEPYRTTLAFDEFRSVDSFQGSIIYGTAGNHEHLIPFDYPVETLVLESIWPGLQSTVGDPLDYAIAGETRPDGGEAGNAPNPLAKTYGKDFFDPEEYAVRLRVHPDWHGLPVEVQGRLFVTLFYVDPAPAGWSFMGGSP